MKPAGGKDAASTPSDRPSGEASPPRDDALHHQVKTLAEERDRLKTELAEERDRYLRARADYENLVRRAQKESLDSIRGAKGSLLLRFTNVLETLEKAAGAPEAPKGVRLVADDIRKLLKDEGIKEIDALGHTFNYRYHQAVESVETTDKPEGTILDVVQRGYLLHNEILRPALVRVASLPKSKPTNRETTAGTA